MSVLLVGDATETYTNDTWCRHVYQEGWQFEALATGTLTELRFRTNQEINEDCTSLWLAIYSDAGNEPSELLAAGEVPGEPPADSWIVLTGLSVAIEAGVNYWLAVHPRGFRVNFATAVGSGGTPDWSLPNEIEGMIDPWTGTDPGDILDWGPVGFQGRGDLTAPPAVHLQPDLIWAVTSLHLPEKITSPAHDEEPAGVLAWATDPMDDLVTFTRNERRVGEVAFSFDDPICAELYRVEQEAATNHEVQVAKRYEAMLFARWRPTGKADSAYPAIWAPITAMNWRSSERKVIVHAVQEQRLVAHQIHRGDDAYEHEDHAVTIGGFGFDEVLAAADVTAEQADDGTPNPGINKPGNVGTSTLRVASALDDGVWDKLLEMAELEGAPDFEVITRDIEDNPFPYYADLALYPDGQGVDRSDTVQFEAKFGRDNAEGVDWDASGPYLTHAVVRNKSNSARVIRANVDARRRTGPYVHVENIASDSPDGTMTARAEALVETYSQAQDSITVKLRAYLPPLEESGQPNPNLFLFSRDFGLGDTVKAEERDAYYHKRAVGQVNEVRLRRGTSDDDKHLIYQELDVVPPAVDEISITDESG